MNSISVILLNARSLRGKYVEFEAEVIDFYKTPEIIAVTETWFSETVPLNMFGYGKYTVYRRDRPNQSYGGVMCLVRNDLASESISSITNLEIIWVIVYLNGSEYYLGFTIDRMFRILRNWNCSGEKLKQFLSVFLVQKLYCVGISIYRELTGLRFLPWVHIGRMNIWSFFLTLI